MKKHLATKILVALIPAALFTQNWAWMSGNKIIGIAFLVLWALLIWNVWKINNKYKILQNLLRISEIGFFLLPISALVLTFVIGSQAVNSTTGAEQAGAAIGTAIGGTIAVGAGFIVGLFGGIIMHLLANRYTKKIKESTEPIEHNENAESNFFEKHKGLTSVAIIIILIIIAAASNNSKADTKNIGGDTATTQQTTTADATAKPQEPPALEVVKTSVTSDAIGTPVANVTVKNTSQKTVDAFKITIKTFNNFGEPANGFLTDNTYDGISQDGRIAPGASYEASWTLYNYDTTTKIEATPYQVHFTDGSTWEQQ